MKKFPGSWFLWFLLLIGFVSCQQRYAYRNTFRVHANNKQEKFRRDQALAIPVNLVSSEPFSESVASNEEVSPLIIQLSNLHQEQRDLPAQQLGSKQKIGSDQYRKFTLNEKLKDTPKEQHSDPEKGKNNLVYLSAALLI